MTLARGTDRLESERLVLRRVTPDDLPLDMVVESAQPEHEMRRGWFGREQAPARVGLMYETRSTPPSGARVSRLKRRVAFAATRLGPLRVAARHRRRASSPAGIDDLGVAERLPFA
jgi:hypothetical protein